MGRIKHLRGYLYIAAGIAFGIYRGMKAENWSSWDSVDILLASGMIGVGLYVILSNR